MSLDALDYALVAAGGAAGATLRYLVGHLGDFPRRVPWGTVVVNLAGSLLLGVLTGLGVTGHWSALLGLGLCGALTTYSSFVVQAHDRGARLGLVTVLVTAPACAGAVRAGSLGLRGRVRLWHRPDLDRHQRSCHGDLRRVRCHAEQSDVVARPE